MDPIRCRICENYPINVIQHKGVFNHSVRFKTYTLNYWVGCFHCGNITSGPTDTLEDAIRIWNDENKIS